MSHFAQVIDGIVQTVIVAEQDFIDTLTDPENWIKTSYNTRGGIHYKPNSIEPDDGVALRGNYAAPGYIYDAKNDVFYPPRPLDAKSIPCASWTINSPDWTWTPPVPCPPTLQDGYLVTYLWDEATQRWYEELKVKAPVTTGTQTL